MRVPVYVSRNPDFRLPTDPAVPITMVGPGTGLAPFRSFLKDRTLSGSPCGQALLYFGCRRRDQDYLYGDLLEAWHREGQVTLFTAFSREGAKKVYVQDRCVSVSVDETPRVIRYDVVLISSTCKPRLSQAGGVCGAGVVAAGQGGALLRVR